jgi:hypothetical protein
VGVGVKGTLKGAILLEWSNSLAKLKSKQEVIPGDEDTRWYVM